jgi:hypothetical protein
MVVEWKQKKTLTIVIENIETNEGSYVKSRIAKYAKN